MLSDHSTSHVQAAPLAGIAALVDSAFPVQALPAWNALMLAKRPVALSMPDCAQVKALALQARVRHSIPCRLPSPLVMQLSCRQQPSVLILLACIGLASRVIIAVQQSA